MARLFNVEVFNKTIGGDATTPPVYFTGQEFYGLLGSADTLSAQVIIDAITTINTTVTVKYERTNAQEQETWESKLPDTVFAATKFGLPVVKFITVSAADTAAYGRFKILSDVPGVTVRIIVCGRST